MFYGQNPYGYQNRSIGENIRRFLTGKSALNRLIVINIAVYLAFLLLKMLFSLFAFLMNSETTFLVLGLINRTLACPASFSQLLYQPWSIITSLFIHVDFWHIFMNMLMLYVTGKIFTQYLDDKRLIITYFLGGITGNLLYMLAYNYFPVFNDVVTGAQIVGASGSVMAIMAAITAYRPKHELNLLLIGRVKLYVIMLIFIFIDLISIPQGNAGGHIAHLGGVLYGFISQFFYRRYQFNLRFQKKEKKNKKGKKKYTTSYDFSQRPVSDEDYNARKVAEQKRIDEILDKISKNGYDALSKEEKDFLFHYGKK